MTDWVKAVKESEDDGEKMSQGQEAKDRVGRNDRLSQGSRESERWEEGGEGGGQSRTEWAGMTDWVPAVEEREGGKGEKTGEGKEVRQGKAANNRVGRNDRLGWGREEESTLRERTRREAKKELRTEWAGMTDWVQAGSVEEKVSVERKSGD